MEHKYGSIIIRDKAFSICEKIFSLKKKKKDDDFLLENNVEKEEKNIFIIKSKIMEKPCFFKSKDNEEEYLIENLVENLSDEKEVFVFVVENKVFLVFNKSTKNSIYFDMKKMPLLKIAQIIKVANLSESSTGVINIYSPERYDLSPYVKNVNNITEEDIDLAIEEVIKSKKPEDENKVYKILGINIFSFLATFVVFNSYIYPYLNTLHEDKKNRIEYAYTTISTLDLNIEKNKKEIEKWKNKTFDHSDLKEIKPLEINELSNVISNRNQFKIKEGVITETKTEETINETK